MVVVAVVVVAAVGGGGMTTAILTGRKIGACGLMTSILAQQP